MFCGIQTYVLGSRVLASCNSVFSVPVVVKLSSGKVQESVRRNARHSNGRVSLNQEKGISCCQFIGLQSQSELKDTRAI